MKQKYEDGMAPEVEKNTKYGSVAKWKRIWRRAVAKNVDTEQID